MKPRIGEAVYNKSSNNALISWRKMEGTIADTWLQSPFTAMVGGPTGSGKTQLLLRLINNAATVANPPPVAIHYCHGGGWQKAFDSMRNVTFHEGLADVECDIPNDGKNRWLILDDLMSETKGGSTEEDLYTKHSHHRNISVFIVLQNIFVKGARTVSLNTHYFFIFKNPRDTSFMRHFARQLYPNNSAFAIEAFADVTRQPYSYLLFDLKQETNEKLRVIGNFAGSEGPAVVYVPK